MLVARHWIGRLFTPNESVIAAAGSLLIAGAAFQLCDGLQVVATGALRGLGDTRTPMLTHLCGYWFVGLPIGYWLCFRAGWNALGMWVGFSIALILIGATLALLWGRRARRLRA
jgi:MATE family, multidrug efflux pump